MRWSRRRTLRALACLGATVAPGCNAASREEPRAPGGSRSRSSGSTDRGSLGRRSEPAFSLPTVESPELRVLSYNVNFGVADDPRNVAAVVDASADLVLLQETTSDAEEAFRAALGESHPHMLFRECCRAGGLGVMSRHPIVEEAYLEPTVGWFPAWRVVVDTPLGHVQALDVHLRPPMSDGGSWVAGFFSTRDVRREEMEGLYAELDLALPTIVAGDFNEDDSGRAVEFLAEQGLRSALPQVAPRAKTWRWQTRMGKLRMMLDHVTYGPELVLRHAEVIEQGVSDHFPVLAVLGLASDPAA